MTYLYPGAGKRRESVPAPSLPDAPALTSAVAAGATPTKAEYDALRADAAALRTKLNALLAALRTGGTVSP